jgi:hypothetical protein
MLWPTYCLMPSKFFAAPPTTNVLSVLGGNYSPGRSAAGRKSSVKNVPSFRTRLPLIWPLGNFDTTFAAKGLGECPTLVQTVSNVCCIRAYDCQRRLFHKLFNIFVEKFVH